jgi:predicted RNA-binding Zn-ribbon protein involved in translation (DUF1610 family)
MTTNKTKTLELTCPKCGTEHEDAKITLNLSDMTECECSSCSLTFSPAEALAYFRAQVNNWQALLDWIDSAPTV